MKHTFPALPLARRFAALPPRYYTPTPSTPLPEPRLLAFNDALADELGLASDAGAQAAITGFLAGNAALADYPQLASVYSGHQFGVWAGQLGDGRALLVAEIDTPAGVQELQLKGAGLTPYSRMGDGRAVLRSSIREYLASEAMHALGIPTTRALALVASPQPVWRETRETAAVVTRVAPSFLRFGHFEHFYYRGEFDAVTELADFAIAHFFPECADADQPYLALLDGVVERTAQLIARWQAVGFCHGVMNTDNMSLLGLTLDYGPYGFLDGFDTHHVCNHSDERGRYAYDQQPAIALWNLHCFAQTLLKLIGKDEALAALHRFQPLFEEAFAEQLRGKLGLLAWQEDDWTLFTDLLELMQEAHTDWTIFWRRLARQHEDAGLRDLFLDRVAFDGWLVRYRARLAQENRPTAARVAAMNAVNPRIVLRNHLAELAIRGAEAGDCSELHRLAAALARPFDELADHDDYAAPPPEWAAQLSVSCSS